MVVFGAINTLSQALLSNVPFLLNNNKFRKSVTKQLSIGKEDSFPSLPSTHSPYTTLFLSRSMFQPLINLFLLLKIHSLIALNVACRGGNHVELLNICQLPFIIIP